ncbi:MAG: zinc-binding dehydrogenase [Xanthomonadales bacterium]|nr:zinc-binding dehydrogenase [Xanthomonadales bacterium]
MWVIALPMEWRARRNGARYFRFLTESDGARLAEIAEVLDAGKVKPVIDSVFGFDQSIAALEHQAGGHAKGKVIIEMTTAG